MCTNESLTVFFIFHLFSSVSANGDDSQLVWASGRAEKPKSQRRLSCQKTEKSHFQLSMLQVCLSEIACPASHSHCYFNVSHETNYLYCRSQTPGTTWWSVSWRPIATRWSRSSLTLREMLLRTLRITW